MATWQFTTPSVAEGPASWDDWLFSRVKLARGISIVENPPGTLTAVRFPTQDQIASSSPRFWQGGYTYVASDQDRNDLINANIGVTAANFVQLS